MSIFEYNGSAVVAMTGKNCVAIASDTRYGIQLQTIATDFQRIYPVTDKTYVGLAGLATDVQTFAQTLQFRAKLYKLREERELEPQTCDHLISSLLYAKRFGPYFIEPVVAGLDKNNEPFVDAQDSIGCGVECNDFVVAGTSSEELYGMCESLYKPDMEPEQLFETISQCLLAAVDRDCLAGWGAVVHIITPEGVTTRKLKSRHD
ncbi:MAG: Proteasome subunit beta type-3-A [Cercozoa sp. M6MM]